MLYRTVSIAKAILLKQGLWHRIPGGSSDPGGIAKAILLKQGLWLFHMNQALQALYIAKAILLKQGLWREWNQWFHQFLSLQKLFY